MCLFFMKFAKKSLLALLGALSLGIFSCSNENIDVNRDYNIVKIGDTVELYGKKFVVQIIDDSSFTYLNLSSQERWSLIESIPHHMFYPDSSVIAKLIKTRKSSAEIESYQVEKEDYDRTRLF